jgi:hypothetical protein
VGEAKGGRMESAVANVGIHPSFLKLIEICKQMKFGTIKELKIQDGLPVFVTYDIRTELDAVIEKSVKLV